MTIKTIVGSKHECWKNRIEISNEIIYFHCNEVGQIKRNCSRLRTKVVTPRRGLVGEKVRPARNARPGNPKNRGGNKNDQKQGRVFALMPGDARNNEDVLTGNVMICYLFIYVLFNTGSSHTFVLT